jgi:hypothetical protein
MGDDLLFPLVDEPIGAIVDRIQSEEAAVAALAASPRRQLAFRTFAYVRVGILLGRLLVERDLEPVAGEEGTWVDQLLADPEVIEAVRAEVRAVAEEVASDPSLAGAEPVGPDDATRERFRAFARRLGR